jgi:hypothetical protein
VTRIRRAVPILAPRAPAVAARDVLEVSGEVGDPALTVPAVFAGLFAHELSLPADLGDELGERFPRVIAARPIAEPAGQPLPLRFVVIVHVRRLRNTL